MLDQDGSMVELAGGGSGLSATRALSSAFVAAALDQAAIVAVTDVRGVITQCNDLFCDVSGYPREELIGANHRLLNSGLHPTAFFVDMYKTIARGQTWRGSICNRRKQGDLYWVDTTIVPQLGVDGRPQAYLAIRFEVTAHKQALADLEVARERAEKAAQAKGRFLATMSHELRTPLTGVVGLSELLSLTHLDERQRDYVSSLLEASGALQAIVNDVLNLAKAEANVSIRIAPLNPVDLARAIRRLLSPVAAKKGVGLTLNCDPDLPEFVTGDVDRLRQVVINLVGNALKFTETGEVAVSVGWTGGGADGSLRFDVRDTGPGFANHLKDRLFEPFEQGGDAAPRADEGAGLGLAISASLVKAMGGRIEAENRPEGGAWFWFETPSCVATATNGENAAQEAAICKALNVLIAEDNRTIQRLLQAILESAGHVCTFVENGAAAVEALRSLPFDVCLMDIRMPVMDGVTATRILRTQSPERWPLPPIIALSADVLDGDLAHYEELGFHAFLPKPINAAALLNALVDATRLRQRPKAPG